MNTDFGILNSFIDSISIVNSKGDIIFTNTAWQNFAKENEGEHLIAVGGVNYIETCKLVQGDEAKYTSRAVTGIEKVIKRELAIFQMEYPCHSPKEKRWFILRVMPLDSDNEFTMITHVNITDRKLAEEKADQKNKQLNVINDRLHTTMYKIAHDIKSPLSSIEGLLNLSKMENQSTELNPYCSLIEKSINNLKLFIQDTLKLSATEGNIAIEPIDFTLLINNYFESIKYSDDFKNIKTEIHINQPNKFYSDNTEVNSIISNIVSNSIKYRDYSKPETYVIITIEVNENEAVISIKDNGIGISKEFISKIFDLKYQVNKNSNLGSGIGLHLVQKSIEFIKGCIKVKSELNKGTEFTISMPNLWQTE